MSGAPQEEHDGNDAPWRPHDARARLSRTLGWGGLAGWASVGLGLEAAHGLKLASYLDDELTRLLLTLAHAHGAALSIVLVLFAGHGLPLLAPADHLTERALIAGWAALPLGFALGAIGHPEGDPSLAIFLGPPAGAAIVAALARVAIAAWRGPREGQGGGPDPSRPEG